MQYGEYRVRSTWLKGENDLKNYSRFIAYIWSDSYVYMLPIGPLNGPIASD